MRPADYLLAARCPPTLTPQEFGLWEICRTAAPEHEPARAIFKSVMGGYEQTSLCRLTEATMHLDRGEVVMEDSLQELRRHLPIWLRARGRVLVTGLGLGCVVRGLLASEAVRHVDVVELDRDIIRVVGAEFATNPRVTIRHGDALKCEIDGRWDFAWHDIWCEGSGLQLLHVELLDRFNEFCEAQGAWMLPRFVKRMAPWPVFG